MKRKWKMKWKLLCVGLYEDYMSYGLNSLKGVYIGDFYRGLL